MTLDDLAHQAAALWGASNPQLISHRENAVFRVDHKGQPAALRLHRAGYQSPSAIEAELTWTDRLAANGFPCPRPIPSTAGNLCEIGASGAASLVTWIDATPIGPRDDPQPQTYRRLGALLRQLHDMTADLKLPPLPRHRWDSEGLLGETPLWGRFWEHPLATETEAKRLRSGRAWARKALFHAPEPILIHADAIQENVLDDGAQLWLIDFDDAGYGYPGYELGSALSQHTLGPDLDTLRTALFEGYEASPDTSPLYEMLRACASAGWAMTRVPMDDPRQRAYLDRALTLAERRMG